MQRNLIEINRDLCNGCSDCVAACQEGGLQIIDNKAYLVNDFICIGLGSCISHCPACALSLVKREEKTLHKQRVMLNNSLLIDI